MSTSKKSPAATRHGARRARRLSPVGAWFREAAAEAAEDQRRIRAGLEPVMKRQTLDEFLAEMHA